MDDQVPGVFPSKVAHIVGAEGGVCVAEHRELVEDVDDGGEPNDGDNGAEQLDNLCAQYSGEEGGAVGDKEGAEHDLEDVSGQVVVDEEGAVVEVEGEVVHQEPGQENLASVAEGGELRLWNVVDETSSPEQVEDKQGGVEQEADAASVPDHDVAHQVHLVVRLLRDVVRDASRQERPLGRVRGKVVVLDVLLVRDQHLDLQLPERELGLALRDELVGHHLLLDGRLVLVVLGVPVLLHVPHSVRLLDVAIGGHLELHEPPLGIILAGEPQSGARVHVHQPHLAVDRVPHLSRGVVWLSC